MESNTISQGETYTIYESNSHSYVHGGGHTRTCKSLTGAKISAERGRIFVGTTLYIHDSNDVCVATKSGRLGAGATWDTTSDEQYEYAQSYGVY